MHQVRYCYVDTQTTIPKYTFPDDLIGILVINSGDNCRTGVTTEMKENIKSAVNFFTSILKYFDTKESKNINFKIEKVYDTFSFKIIQLFLLSCALNFQ